MTARLARDGKQAGGKGKLDDSPVVRQPVSRFSRRETGWRKGKLEQPGWLGKQAGKEVG